jgi:hypothetical protein
VTRSKRIKVVGVRKADAEIDIEMVSLAYWIQAKRVVRERRQKSAQIKAKREKRQQ